MRIIDSLVDSIPHLFNRNEIRDEIGMINYSIGPSWSVGPVQRFREGARWEAESWLVTRGRVIPRVACNERARSM